MSADIDFERRVRSDLRSGLDRATGPHPEWATAPAAAIVASDPARPARAVPWRLMAVAAVLLIGSVAAVILARPDIEQEAGVPGCPTLADYAAASAQPSAALGEAPGVSFPPVAPTATMTTGRLQPGDWAVIANADGPGLQIRVRDVRNCGRLPTVRSSTDGGSIVLITVDAKVLRDDTGMTWFGVRDLVGLAIGEGPEPMVQSFDVPGVDWRTQRTLSKGFASSGTLILDLPRTDKLIALEHPTENTQTLPGLAPTTLDWPRVRWVLQDGDPTGYAPNPILERVEADPEATPTTGEVRPGEDVAMVTSAGAALIQLRYIDEVPAYPGLAPAPGHVFVEVLVTVRDMGNSLISLRGWRAVDGEGHELPIIHDQYGADQRPGLLRNLIREVEESDEAWIVIEAPATGPVRLEYSHEDILDAMFWIDLRD
jgi:hypothetical protein